MLNFHNGRMLTREQQMRRDKRKRTHEQMMLQQQSTNPGGEGGGGGGGGDFGGGDSEGDDGTGPGTITFPAGVFPAGAIAYYSFDNVLADSTGNGRTLSPFDVGDPLTYALGINLNGIQLGRDFNVATNFLVRTDDAFNFGANVDKSFTIAGWFRCTVADNPVWISYGHPDYVIDQVAVGASITASFRSTTGNETLNSLFVPINGVFFFMVMQWDHSVNRGYFEINRANRLQTAVLGQLDNLPGSTLSMGWGSTIEAPAQNNLLFDELGFWPSFLSSTDLDYLYNSGNGRAYNS